MRASTGSSTPRWREEGLLLAALGCPGPRGAAFGAGAAAALPPTSPSESPSASAPMPPPTAPPLAIGRGALRQPRALLALAAPLPPGPAQGSRRDTIARLLDWRRPSPSTTAGNALPMDLLLASPLAEGGRGACGARCPVRPGWADLSEAAFTQRSSSCTTIPPATRLPHAAETLTTRCCTWNGTHLPAFAGTTMGALARGVRVRVGDAPPRAPALDSRFRGNDDGGVGARGSCQGGGCAAPRPCPGFPLSRERRWGRWREGLVSGWGMHRPAPLPWIPAFAGTTMGALARGVRVRVRGCTAPRPCPGFPLSRERRWGNADSGSAPAVALRGVGTGRPP